MIEYLIQSKIASYVTLPRNDTKASIIHQDVLQRDENTLSDFPFGECTDSVKKKTLVVGNLPYYITSPILRKFFAFTQPTRAG
jgi:16S rRNA A1518/A1519 N6-dimethyltransferase RsmA/KsgA/DIM1 with predicted DNA glycosylase/AP lyase activity